MAVLAEDNMEKIIYTVREVSEIIHTNQTYVYSLIKAGLLPALKLGSYKVRKTTLINFLEKYEGYDLTDPLEFIQLTNLEDKQKSHSP